MPLLNTPLRYLEKIQNVNIHLWRQTETLDELIFLLPDVSMLQLPPYADFKSDKRRTEWVAVRALLHQVCQRPVKIVYDENGCPSLFPAISNLSISHTKGVVGIALSDQPVGLDIEQQGDRALKLRNYFLSEEEVDFSHCTNAEQLATMMWSAKESVYKLIHQKGLELKADIRLSIQNESSDYVQLLAHVTMVSKPVTVHCFAEIGYVLTVAVF